MALTLAKIAGNNVIPAKAGIQNVRNLSNLDSILRFVNGASLHHCSGSPLRSAQNDGILGLSKHRWGRRAFNLFPPPPFPKLNLSIPCQVLSLNCS